MKILITCQALVYPTNDDSDEPLEDPAILSQLAGWSNPEKPTHYYFDNSLADIGITGGTMETRYSEEDGLQISAIYWSPRALTEDELHELCEDTQSQWSDGIGEGGFQVGDDAYTVMAWEETVTARQVEDPRLAPGPPLVAIAAREGDMQALLQAIAAGGDMNEFLQGETALGLAVSCGHYEIAKVLLETGADPNVPEQIMHKLPISSCASTRMLDNETSARMARLLFQHGAKLDLATEEGKYTLKLAEIRGRTQLIEVLKERAENAS